MLTFGALGFVSPAILIALVALPVLWWMLRAVPPAPVRRRFPGIALLLGLHERDPESQRTPWWLLLLRIGALAALILALAGPVLNPQPSEPGSGPLLVVMDASWASAANWPQHIERAGQALAEARREGRTVAVVTLTAPPADPLAFRGAEHWQERLAALAPQPVAPHPDLPDWVSALPAQVDTLWLSDGLAHEGRGTLHDALSQRGRVRVFEPRRGVLALAPARFDGGSVSVPVRRSDHDTAPTTLDLVAIGPDPAGTERELARAEAAFAAGETETVAEFALQPELRNRVTRFQIVDRRGAGATSLTDDGLRRRKVGLLDTRDDTEALALLTPLHYLRQALAPGTDLIEDAGIDELLLSAPDVIVLADMPGLSDDETTALLDWVDDGGLLLRFAGPRMAAAGQDDAVGAANLRPDDPLLPVPLRMGGRTVGGAMSWGEPRRLAPFRDDTPFAGLSVPEDVEIRAQVLAQPDPELAERSIAELADGTPLVTRRMQGAGQIVLFHVTANAEWSSLPLSGLFVDMLERLSVSARGSQPEPADMAGTDWQLETRIDGFGQLHRASDRPAIDGAVLSDALIGARPLDADLAPGLYAGPSRRVALNATDATTRLDAARWTPGTEIETGLSRPEQPLAGYFLALTAMLLMADALATLALGGRLVRTAIAVLALGMVAIVPAADAQTGDRAAQSSPDTSDGPVDARILEATESVVLAHVATGDARVDEIARAGLEGLSEALFRRSSVEPGAPMEVDPETDELALFPFLYWPIVETSPIPSSDGYARLNRYLRSGGMILFDTRDAEVARLSGTTPEARRLRAIAAGLDIPPLEPVPSDHVLTRTFYLLSDFPGRHANSTVWVEAARADAERAEGMPFRELNDGVTPVVIGGNDWAAAWAIDEDGLPLLPVGRGMTGERQREMALRFGVNLIMHVLSGNYKSDQVHVPALLERLGQ
ncbi:MAG: N-terminal double-transmembrane domain [Rhodobacteraceae bacterium HLUCCA12]|nr:MAG: N-terminal double-transmembrane domain [Rhodobacteraceae bacterium HLUCCA12]